MGNTRSELFQQQVSVDPWWNSNQRPQYIKSLPEIDISALKQRRIKIIGEKKKEMDDLRQELLNQKKENEDLKKILSRQRNVKDASHQTDSFEVPGQAEAYDHKIKLEELQEGLKTVECTKEKNRLLHVTITELQSELQRLKSELVAFNSEREEYKTHVVALKDIIAVSKQLLFMRENQIKELNQTVEDLKSAFAQKEVEASDDLRKEYEKQLKNIKHLKALYEERQQADRSQINKIKSQLEDANSAVKSYEERNGELQIRIDELEKDNDSKTDSVFSLESQLGLAKADFRELRAEMNVINQLFSQILLSFNNSQDVNLDNLIKTLEENHDLLTDIFTNEGCNETSSALPKVLLDLVNQVNEKDEPAPSSSKDEHAGLATIPEETDTQSTQSSLNSATEIVQNLPKVWRVLIELLSHQSTPTNDLNTNPDSSDSHPCYKLTQTPSGPIKVLSVSQTFIRLKNLILEKKSLEKETSRLKQLNTHLETRLQDQEKRLELVSHELSNTWHVVGKMQKQHQQLHTQEKILRYELAQKRKLLNELKEELEYCREKWLQAREKNSTTEEQWKQLRSEFAARKTIILEDFNNSAESGYSDERESSSGEEDFEVESAVTNSEPKPDNEEPTRILQVIRDEIATIEGTTHDSDPSEETSKTDLVQNKETQNTEVCTQPDTLHQPKTARQDIDEMYKRLEEDILQTIKKTQNGEEYPSTSQQSRTTEEILLAREQRLKRLEEESNQLINQATKTSDRSIEMCSKLDNLHQQYGEGGSKFKDQKQPQTLDTEEVPSTSTDKTSEAALTRKEERLLRLEKEAKQLVGKAMETSAKSLQICNKLDELHDRYGETSTSSAENVISSDVSECTNDETSQE